MTSALRLFSKIARPLPISRFPAFLLLMATFLVPGRAAEESAPIRFNTVGYLPQAEKKITAAAPGKISVCQSASCDSTFPRQAAAELWENQRRTRSFA
jgi:hypothetical protein